MTVETRVIKLDESKVVVVRNVPMTADTSDKLRSIRRKFQEEYRQQTGESVTIPFPVALDRIIKEYQL